MKKILLLLPQGFEFLEAAAFIDVFGWNQIAGDKTTALYCLGCQEKIDSSFNHSMNADLLLEEIDAVDFAALAIPGGFARFGYFRSAQNQAIVDLIRQFDRCGKPIAAICTAALLLAGSGILRGRKAITYGGEDGRWLRQLADYGAIIDQNNPCLDQNIITSSDPASAPRVALKLLAMLTDQENAEQIAKMMGY